MRTREHLERTLSSRAALVSLVILGLGTGRPSVAQEAPAQSAPRAASAEVQHTRHHDGLPFFAGEQLSYHVRVSKVGSVGKGAMTVDGPVNVRGVDTYLLRFEFRTRVGFVTAENKTESWIDPSRMAALRFRKRERHPLSRHDEAVELFPEERRWDAGNGQAGESPTDAPLDELSFIYAIRTIPLPGDTTYKLDRHFDSARNPVTLRVLGRDTIKVGAGTFPAVLVEMRVKDGRRYKDEGVIRIHFSDDHCRLPLRIESSMPVLGTVVFSLESRSERPAGQPVTAASGDIRGTTAVSGNP